MSQQDQIVETPPGEVLIRIPFADVDALMDWFECAAVRLAEREDGTFELQFARDLEAITRPEGSA